MANWQTSRYSADAMGTLRPHTRKEAKATPEQPATTYPQFKREILSEIARCLGMPYNVAACDSSTHNYASGRLDDQLYRRSIGIEQDHLEQIVLDPLLAAFLAEARLVPGLLPPGPWFDEAGGHQWFWEGLEDSDPRWTAAEADLVKTGLLTEARYYGRRGYDWEAEISQRKREKDAREASGLPQPWDRPEAAPATPAKTDDADDKPPDRTAAHFAPTGRGGR